MHVSKRAALAALAAAALGGSAATAVTATGHEPARRHTDPGRHGARKVLESTMAPSVPSDHALHGVSAGMAPWVLRRGEASLRRDGRLRVIVRGLVIPPPTGNGTPGQVMTVSASLYCGNDTDTTALGTTPAVPISRRGDARMAARLTLPAKCLAPVVLVHPNNNPGAYISATGFGG